MYSTVSRLVSDCKGRICCIVAMAIVSSGSRPSGQIPREFEWTRSIPMRGLLRRDISVVRLQRIIINVYLD